MMPIVSEISQYNTVEHLDLAMITDKHVNCEWLFDQAGLLFSTEIWNTFGAWIEGSNPKLSPGVEYNFKRFAKPANRKDIQNSLYKTNIFSKKLNEYLHKGNILCFPTTLDLAPRLDQITDEFLSVYYPRAMGITAISGLSRTPQITIPIANSDGVPIGLSFIAGYGQDMMLVNFCNELQTELVRK
jgi:amidase